jgi:CRP-like cAMP-binding protein
MNTSLAPSANKLLAALPDDDLQTLTPNLTTLPLAQGDVLFEMGQEIEHIYFPLSGMISLLTVLKTGDAIEIATVGREGVVGAMVGLGITESRVRATIQLPANVSRIGSRHFRAAAATSKPIAHMCVVYNEELLAQARITAACNITHRAEARFCRWLLQSRDRAESDTLLLTQEFISEMLGIRRTSVTEIATKMQGDGLISYSRGVIKILDLPKLRALACECYENLREGV